MLPEVEIERVEVVFKDEAVAGSRVHVACGFTWVHGTARWGTWCDIDIVFRLMDDHFNIKFREEREIEVEEGEEGDVVGA